MALSRYKWRQFNFRLLIYAVVLTVIGIFAIRSATAGTPDADIYQKQIMGLLLGLAAVAVCTVIDYHLYLKFTVVIYAINIILLLSVKFIGKEVGGAKRWVILPVIGQFQPSELTKIILILCLATVLYHLRDRINKVGSLFLICIFAALPIYLIFDQPDLSTTIVCLFIFVIMLYVAKISYKWIFRAILCIIPVVAFVAYQVVRGTDGLLKQHQINRILSFINPEQYADLWYQQANSIIAIGSGGLTGKGLFNTTYESVKTGNFLVESQTDFIFAIVGEELGFVGAVAVVLLLALISFECMWMARNTKDMPGRLICVGTAALIGFQGFVNIAVATGLIPNTGIPLPFVSYGVSSLLSLYIGVGILLNVGLQREVQYDGGLDYEYRSYGSRF